MTKEERELLLQDLSARLPYGVQILQDGVIIETLFSIEKDAIGYVVNAIHTGTAADILSTRLENCKPYLRPMASMTSDERFEYDELQHFYTHGLDFNVDEVDWLNAHHFDYRNLIGKRLALPAPKDMYKEE